LGTVHVDVPTVEKVTFVGVADPTGGAAIALAPNRAIVVAAAKRRLPVLEDLRRFPDGMRMNWTSSLASERHINDARRTRQRARSAQGSIEDEILGGLSASERVELRRL
jgi:hypothetical protein